MNNLLYVGLVTRNQLGVYGFDDAGDLSFVRAVLNSSSILAGYARPAARRVNHRARPQGLVVININ